MPSLSHAACLVGKSQGHTHSSAVSGTIYSAITTHEGVLLRQQKLRLICYRCPTDWSSELCCRRYRSYTRRCSSHLLL